MVLNIETVIEKTKAYAMDVKRILPVERVVLCGSCADGATPEGNIDLCFFLKDFGGKKRAAIAVDLLKVLHHNKYYGLCDFVPRVFTLDDIRRHNPFVKEVFRTGIEIYANR
jgi:hypothetical protein